MLVRTFFGFSRVESNGFILFIPLTLFILLSEPLYDRFTRSDENYFANIVRTDSLMALMRSEDSVHALEARKAIDTIVFHPFDPNSVDEAKLVALGMKKALAARMSRYREKGGTFRKKQDVLKIFGMDTSWYRKAQAWMLFPEQIAKASPFEKSTRRQSKVREDINTADSTQLVGVYGIGPVLARRIIQFRDRLGGFIAMDQLREVYGLDTTVVKNLTRRFEVLEGFEPRMLNLNEVSLEALMAHPYISRREAQAIISYRLQHGAFDSIGQLREVRVLNVKWLEKIQSYLRTGNK